jgi:hypothetical protein
MAKVLPPDLTFAALRDRLQALGWVEKRIPALLPPLLPGEPEAAAFARNDQRLDYRFNPALRLRVIEGPAPADLPELPASALPGLIRSPDPEVALLGAEAAAVLGQGDLRTLILLRTMQLPADLALQARNVAHRLAPLCAEARAFPALPPDRQAQILRLALHHRSPDTGDLALFGLGASPDVAATAMIAAARLNQIHLLPAFPRQATGELHVAIRKLASASLRGEMPGPEASARNRFWRALLGQGDPDMELRLAPFVEPAPDPWPAETHGGIAFRRVGAVPHWLGDPDIPGTARRVTPHPFLIAEAPVLICRAAEVLATLAALGAQTGLRLRLPTVDELACALRGTDGRLRPGAPHEATWQSPWGLVPGEARHEFCASGYMIHRSATDHPVASVPAAIDDDPSGLRPVVERD